LRGTTNKSKETKINKKRSTKDTHKNDLPNLGGLRGTKNKSTEIQMHKKRPMKETYEKDLPNL